MLDLSRHQPGFADAADAIGSFDADWNAALAMNIGRGPVRQVPQLMAETSEFEREQVDHVVGASGALKLSTWLSSSADPAPGRQPCLSPFRSNLGIGPLAFFQLVLHEIHEQSETLDTFVLLWKVEIKRWQVPGKWLKERRQLARLQVVCHRCLHRPADPVPLTRCLNDTRR